MENEKANLPIPEKKSEVVKETKKIQPFQTSKGMRDIFPEDAPAWFRARESAADIGDMYGFGYIETPILENSDLFTRGVGMGTDIVEKEMYVLKTKGGDSLALRPEFTAPVMRSFIENGMSRLPQPVKLWYFGPNFRHENPQSGRYRQFYQTGFEIIGGESDPSYDAQIIVACVRLLEKMKIKDPLIEINSIGCRACRNNYRKKLNDFYRRELASGKKKAVCRDCERRLDTNILRLLDCKNPECEELKSRAPSVLDSLCTPCRTHFREVLEFLDEIGLSYSLNPYLVRGLDYYNRTVFEIFVEEGENNLALGGGGRYDYLAEMIGGRSTPAVGAAMGIDRIINLLKERDQDFEPKKKDKVFVAHVGDMAKRKAFKLVEELLKGGVKVGEALGKDSLQAQLKVADREGSPFSLIIGQKEVYEESVIIRDMKTGAQENVPVSKIVDEVKKRLHKNQLTKIKKQSGRAAFCLMEN